MTSPPGASGAEVVVYTTPDGEVRVEVRLDEGTVWLTQAQIAELLGRDQSVVSRHIRRVFRDGELAEAGNMQKVHMAPGARPVALYSLDVIISDGYRVNSVRGSQFRIWATQVLRQHLIRGFTLHERRLAQRGLVEFEQAVDLLTRTLASNAMVTDEGRAVLDVVQRYTRSWSLLLEYDEQRLAERPARPVAPSARLGIEEARQAAARMREDLASRGEAGALFAQERGDALAGILGAIEQTFDGRPLYPSAQVRAAHILYFVIKDHPFSDGNKRIGTLLFLDYLRRNGLLLRADGAPRLAANAVVALALLVAESAPAHKDLLIRLTLGLLGDDLA